MIFDAFPFLNEIEVLKIRMKELEGIVDRFVILEYPLTFSGHAKPNNFLNAVDEHFGEWKSKIIWHTNQKIPSGLEPWGRERWMRDDAKTIFRIADDDVVIWGDVDEVPRASAVEALTGISGSACFIMPHLYYYLNFRAKYDWSKCKIMSGARWNQFRLSLHRLTSADQFIENAGWHFAYMGGVDNVLYKIQSFSHCNDANIPGLVRDYTNGVKPEERNAAEYGLHKVEIDETYPACIRENVEHYRSLGMIL